MDENLQSQAEQLTEGFSSSATTIEKLRVLRASVFQILLIRVANSQTV